MKTENNIYKPIFLLVLVFCVALSMPFVCAASDINNASSEYDNVVDFEVNNVEVSDVPVEASDVELNNDDEVEEKNVGKTSKNSLASQGDFVAPGTYDDFVKDLGNLTPGSVVELTKDYNLDSNTYSYITLDKENVTINGNGHWINGYKKDSRIFKITADGVKINNLVFTNPAYDLDNTELALQLPLPGSVKVSNYGYSPIIVNGNYDEINRCRFTATKAVNGGSIFWTGDNGKIDTCLFTNIGAKCFGGAVYMEGLNNTIGNCRFDKCLSGLSQDAIYLENAQKNVVKNCMFGGNSKIFDGKGSLLNVSLFADSYPVKVADKEIELNRILYIALSEGGSHYLDKDTWYYCDYFNESHDVVLNVFRNFTDNGILFGKGYHFKNVSTVSDVFTFTKNLNYQLDYTLVKNVYVNDSNGYSAAIKTTSGCFDSVMGYMSGEANSGVPAFIKSRVLNIVLADAMDIDCGETIMASNLGFNVINIDGHGSHIKTSSDDDDENKWFVLTSDVLFSANDLTVSGFNTAVENMAGQCIFDNVSFKDNRMDYTFDRDWGAGMLNLGVVMCYNCSFENNYAKNGGAIFNQGLLVLENCSFVNNEAYGEGNDVCVGDNGKVVLDGVALSGSAGPVTFVESMSTSSTVVTGALCIGVSFVAGFVAGVLTANPIVGAAVGAAVGVAVGSAGSAYIIANHYDVNFDRLKTALIVVGGSVVAGVAGGVLGGYITMASAGGSVPEAAPVADEVSEAGSVSEASSVGEDLLLDTSLY